MTTGEDVLRVDACASVMTMPGVQVPVARKRPPGFPPGAFPAFTSAEAHESCLVPDRIECDNRVSGAVNIGVDADVIVALDPIGD